MSGATVPSVPALLARGAAAPAHVDPLDAVMGEDWARLRLGRGGAAREPQGVGAHGAKRRRAALAGALAPNPQALVKLIGAGGAKNARGLRAQMTYLGRAGDVPLRSSESTFGVEIGPDDVGALAAAWGLPETDRGGSDRTSHFVVSFPRDSDPGAAERAGRAWAAALFESGAHGDRWDYYTAFHTDTAYPHIHVVVSRRGLDEGLWLKISARSEISFDRLREVQVEVAGREGIALTGTSRLSRGVHARPVPDAEYRRARREGRAAVPPAHSEASAVHAAVSILQHARGYDGAGEALRAEAPDLAARFERAAATLMAGRALVPDPAERILTASETERMVEKVAEVRAEVGRTFAEIEAEIAGVGDAARRAAYLRELGELRAEGAPFPREDTRLQTYRAEAEHPGYRGLAVAADDPRQLEVKAEAERAVRALAERYGLDPEATLERHARPSVSLGLGADFAREEGRERRASRPDETPARAEAALAEFRSEVESVYRAASRALRAPEREADPARSVDPGRSEPAARTPGANARGVDPVEPEHGARKRIEARPAPARDRDDDERSR